MHISHDLPEPVMRLLDGDDLEAKVGQVVLLTVADGRTPRIASLSVGELLALDRRTILATLYERSRTGRALAATGSGLLLFVDDGGLLKVEVEAEVVAAQGGRATFHCTVVVVERDEVPYARVTRGIEFELVDRQDQVMARWRSQLSEMKELAV
jgi:hypothetical protein